MICQLLSITIAIYTLALLTPKTIQAKSRKSVYTVHLTEQQPADSLIKKTTIFRDPSNKLNIHQIANANPQLFKALDNNGILALQNTSDRIWLRTVIRRVGLDKSRELSKERVFIGTDRSEFKTFNVHKLDQTGKITTYHQGTEVQQDLRPGPYKSGYVPLALKPGEKATFFFEISSRLPMATDLEVVTESQALWLAYRDIMTQFLFYGSLLLLIFFGLITFFYVRHLTLLYYVLFCATLCFTVFFYSGFIEYFRLDLGGLLNSEQYLLIQTLPTFFSILYMKHLFELKKKDPTMQNISNVFLVFVSCALVFIIADHDTEYLFVGDILHASNLILVLFCSYRALNRGDRYAIYYMLGWGGFTVLVSIWLLGQNGFLQKNYFVAFAPLFGNWLQTVGSALAIGARFKDLLETEHQLELKKESEKHLRSLVRVVCHDIANPLSVICHANELSQISGGEKNQKRLWAKVGVASQGIEKIVHQVKRQEASESLKYEPNLSDFSLFDLLLDLKMIFEKRLADKSLRLQYDPSEVQIIIRADRDTLLYDVFCNLLSNAIKFSPKDGLITINITNSESTIMIDIRDEGIGIPDEVLPTLFDKDINDSRLGTQGEKGTGFGLPLVQYFLHGMGGRIDVQTRDIDHFPENHGTAFTLFLPRATELVIDNNKAS